jgi:hypothetical protein
VLLRGVSTFETEPEALLEVRGGLAPKAFALFSGVGGRRGARSVRRALVRLLWALRDVGASCSASVKERAPLLAA